VAVPPGTQSIAAWRFTDVCAPGWPILLRNAVCHAGKVFEVQSTVEHVFWLSQISAIWISRNVTNLGETCFSECHALEPVVFETGSGLCEIGPRAFDFCHGLRSIAIPSSVIFGSLELRCFADCRGLQSVILYLNGHPDSRRSMAGRSGAVNR
jgi:hypothetical protein